MRRANAYVRFTPKPDTAAPAQNPILSWPKGLSYRPHFVLQSANARFCLLHHSRCSALPGDIVAAGEPLTAFAHAELRAEGGRDPRDEYTFRPQLMKLFTERYGASVSASDDGS